MFTIFVTECGGPAGIGIIKSFNALGKFHLVGLDADQNVPQLCEQHFHSPPATDPSYWPYLNQLIKTEKPHLIVCAGEHDLQILSDHQDEIRETGCKIMISSPETISICQNKWLFYNHCRHYLDVPFTLIGPLISKPNRSSGSRGFKIHMKELFQEYLPGIEYTVDVFCGTNHEPFMIVPRQRLQTKSGISTKAKILNDNDLMKKTRRACQHLKLIGACNLQFKEDTNGNRKLLEVNPRLGGGTVCGLAVGANLASYYLYHTGLSKQKPEDISIVPRTVVRYFEEDFI